MKKNLVLAILAIFITAFAFSSCEEPHYYRTHNEHSPRYNEHHHRGGGGVDVRIHN